MHKRRVGVLRGGPSSEYDISLQTGKSVLDNLSEESYIPIDIIVHQDGRWHVGGIEEKPEQVFSKIDLLFNALHGHYGEDGKLQRLLEIHGVPYTGSGSLASALGMHKHLTKDIFKKQGIKPPLCTLVREGEDILVRARDIWRTFPHPAIVKPASAGSSLGIGITDSYDMLVDALIDARTYSDIVIVEEYIDGREATAGVIEDFRGQRTYALPPAEIILPADKLFFDYDTKYVHICRDICPGRFSQSEKRELQEIAVKIHDVFSLRQYSRSDFIVSTTHGAYLLDVNTLPSLTKESLMTKSLQSVGISLPQFLDHIINLTVPA